MFMSENVGASIKLIVKRLDTLISLFRLVNRSALVNALSEIKKDRVYTKILEVASEPIPYSELSSNIAQTLGVAEITVKKKVSELYEMGLLVKERRGREVYYEISDILGGV